ncbi:MAG: hemerythrin domain-containing protein [Sphingobacteriales bacterium]|nr:MAG: hemerythrin domain-containing protein [Sphingobacteriales bacterium]
MKRSEQLYPLSWQHHNGLMAVLLLKKGVHKKADVKVMTRFIQQIRKEELDEHFEAEEKSLILFSDKYHQLGTLYKKMIAEHTSIRQCYRELENPSYAAIEKFYQLLNQHIRFEEREYFPAIEATLSAKELTALSKDLSHLHHQSCSNFPIKFWE